LCYANSGLAAGPVSVPRISEARSQISHEIRSNAISWHTRENSTPFAQDHGQTGLAVLSESNLVISESHNAHSPQVAISQVYSNLFLLHTKITVTPSAQGHGQSGPAILPAGGGDLPLSAHHVALTAQVQATSSACTPRARETVSVKSL
jgi:hypothetical protein